MFSSLKNKIREETGTDLSKLTAKITSSTAQRFEALRGRSHQGSSSSINSIVSSDGAKDESSDGVKTEDEYKKRLMKIEANYARKLSEKDKELQKAVTDRDKVINNLEKEKDYACRQVDTLKESLRSSEDLQRKLTEVKENKEQIENYQSHELAKIKQLVLAKEQELADKTTQLKEVSQQLDKMRTEIGRLRKQEECLSNVQDDLESLRHSSARDLAALATQLAKSEEERRHLSDLVTILRERNLLEDKGDDHWNHERKLLEQRLEEAHLHLADIKTSWSDKIAMLETQVGRLSRQAAEEGAERRRAVQEKNSLLEKMKQLECELECNKFEINNRNSKINRLEAEVEGLSKELQSLQAENEEEVAFLRQQTLDSTTEVKAVRKNLDNTEFQLEKIEDECSKLKQSVDSSEEENRSLKDVIKRLEKELAEEKSNSLNVQKTLSRVTSEKNASLLRNAEISQQMELAKQETRRREIEMSELLSKITSLEDENKKYKESSDTEKDLKTIIGHLEEQLQDRNKNIKMLQLRLADMKKALQQELRTPGNSIDNSIAILAPSQTSTKSFHGPIRRDENDINSTYLKNVLIKFLTSREYEAQHLIKAVSTLLKFSPEEEKLVHDTFEWKMSWFGSRPKLESGQQAKAIPPS